MSSKRDRGPNRTALSLHQTSNKWTKEDSEREMKKWSAVKPPNDPSVQRVTETLEANTQFFLHNIANFLVKYRDFYEKMLDAHPASKCGLDFEGNPVNVVPVDHIASPTLKNNTEPVKVRLIRKKSKGEEKEKKTKKEGEGEEEVEEKEKPKKKVVSPKLRHHVPKVKAKDLKHGVDGDDDDSDESSDYDPSPDAPEVVLPDNTLLREHLRTLKREAYELSTTFDGIHDWIALNVPDMKEEDNTGVEVMETVIEQVESLTDTVRGVYSLEFKYLEDRSEIECDCFKYPDSATQMKIVTMGDERTWDEIARSWKALIRCCTLLFSVMQKNMSKLKNPRQRESHMYHM